MKKILKYNSAFSKGKITGIGSLFLSVSFFLFSCRSADTERQISENQAVVKVNLTDSEFETLSDNSNTKSGIQSVDPNVQVNRIKLTNELDLITEVTPVESKERGQRTIKGGAIDAIVKDPLPNGTVYRVAVYNNNGAFVESKDYTRGNEGTVSMNLNGGSTYTFVVYSVNTTNVTDLPAITYTNPAVPTLATARISNTPGNRDMMYFKTNLTVSGSQTNYLNVILKHRFTQITTVIDASARNANVTAVTGNYSPHSDTGQWTMNLADGVVTRTATNSAGSPIVFPTLNAQVVTSRPTIINSNATNAGVLAFSTLTIGGVTATNVIPYNNLQLTPGVRYTANVRVAQAVGSIANLICASAVFNTTFYNNEDVAANTTLTIPYQGGNGGTYPGQVVQSTGVTGLRATLAAGSFVNGNANLILTISGKPLGEGPAIFTITIGGRTCIISVEINLARGVLIRCVAAGFYPYPNVGDKYLQCVQISGQWYYYVYSCPANSNFNPSVGRCVVGYVP